MESRSCRYVYIDVSIPTYSSATLISSKIEEKEFHWRATGKLSDKANLNMKYVIEIKRHCRIKEKLV